MATFTRNAREGWKKVKYSKGDGTVGYFYSKPGNTKTEILEYKRGLTAMNVERQMRKKQGKPTREGMIAGQIISPDPYLARYTEETGGKPYNVGDIVSSLKRRRKKNKNK